jgi:hypothetical protein
LESVFSLGVLKRREKYHDRKIDFCLVTVRDLGGAKRRVGEPIWEARGAGLLSRFGRREAPDERADLGGAKRRIGESIWEARSGG